MDRRNQQPSRDRTSLTQSWKPQSRIAGYINGTAKLEDIYNADKIVKPQDRHNKRTFHHPNYSPVNRNTTPAAQRAAKLRASTSSSKATTASRPDDLANILPGSASAHSQGDTSSQSCVSSVKASSVSTARTASVSSSMRAVNEQLLAEKDEEIAVLKDRVERLLRSLQPPDRDSATADDATALVDSLSRSLAGTFDAIALCRADMTNERVEQTLAHMEQSRDHWYTLATGLSRAVNALHESDQQLRKSNVHLDEQLVQLRNANETLTQKVTELQVQVDGAGATRHQLNVMAANVDAIQVENERLRGQIRELELRHRQAKDEIIGCLELHNRIEKDTRVKEDLFAARLKQLESEKNEMQTELRRYRDERATAEVGNAQLKREPRMLQLELKRLRDDNEKYQKFLLEMTSQYQRLRDDFEHLQNQKRRLEETLDEWKQAESNLDTSPTIAIARLRTMFDVEESYSKKLMRSLEETALKAKILNENEINTNS